MSKTTTGEIITAKAAADEQRFKFAALDESSEIAEAMRVNLSTGESLSPSLLERVPMPTGGSTTWTFSCHGEDISVKELVGVPVYFGVRQTLWGSSEPSGKSPVLIGHDLATMYRVSDDIGDLDPAVLEAARIGDRTYSVDKLAYCQWGSGSNGKGKRVRESRIVCLLREDDAWPLLIQAGAMSVVPLSEFFVRLAAPYYQCVISLGLEKQQNGAGQPYARIKPKLLGKLSREDGQRLRSTYTAALTRMMQSGGSAAPQQADQPPF